MKVQTILTAKGSEVATIRPDASIVFAVHRLTTMTIGALVISEDGKRVDGTLAESDVVRGLAKHGARFLDMRVAESMSRSVPVCSPEDSIKDAMAKMTRSRRRHLPVVDEGGLCGLISVGDVVKHRLEEMELEASIHRDTYIARR